MNINCQMFIPPKGSYVIVAMEVSKEELILSKKSKIIAPGFGAIGAMISAKSKGKEFHLVIFYQLK